MVHMTKLADELRTIDADTRKARWRSPAGTMLS